ncbi:EamA family transporter [Bacillus shivajii]|uniref:DMT family transporter n=1 Tax=Bacillus shivajii TaxID=1983719 RepID=UPI001CF9B9BE|nr:EamA family transporter [Bacillus shivajii]UCZ55248.1 EamA family transporter [Bacillus shivajii]
MNRELLFIHLAVLLFGFSGLFAALTSLSALAIVFGRVIFASLFLWLVLYVRKETIRLSDRKEMIPFIFIGGLLALHWWSFFHSIQLSSVAIGLITFATFPIFASFLEPIFFRESFQRKNLLFAAISLIGVLVIVPDYSVGSEATQGALWGLVSAITFALLSIVNRKYVQHRTSLQIGFYQNFFAMICLVPLITQMSFINTQMYDIFLLIVLGIVFTGCAHVLYIQGLTKVNVRTASIITTLEPVYGIIAAMLLIQQFPVPREWVGIIIIISLVLYVSWDKEKQKKKIIEEGKRSPI